ncbi:MAG: chemotaxis protein CheW [Deltaproteobacteria bacterium]|nr:MAG: chemotaxis protein CheW [Deltaproteobacteria bacterium]
MQTDKIMIDDCWNRIGVWRTGSDKCPELDHVIHCRNCPVFSKTGRKLLRSEPPEDYRSEWTKILSTEKEVKQFNVKSAFVFRAGSEWLALPAHMIQEVVNMGPIHSIPNINSKVLRGVVNIHGRLQICVSIGRVLGLEKLIRTEEELDPDYISPERLVVVLQDNHLVAFPVSEVKGIVRYTPEMIKDLPVTVSGSKAVYTMGILHLEGKDIGLLKDKPLFKTLTKDLE